MYCLCLASSCTSIRRLPRAGAGDAFRRGVPPFFAPGSAREERTLMLLVGPNHVYFPLVQQ